MPDPAQPIIDLPAAIAAAALDMAHAATLPAGGLLLAGAIVTLAIRLLRAAL